VPDKIRERASEAGKSPFTPRVRTPSISSLGIINCIPDCALYAFNADSREPPGTSNGVAKQAVATRTAKTVPANQDDMHLTFSTVSHFVCGLRTPANSRRRPISSLSARDHDLVAVFLDMQL
jgi:hypothetical protein